MFLGDCARTRTRLLAGAWLLGALVLTGCAGLPLHDGNGATPRVEVQVPAEWSRSLGNAPAASDLKVWWQGFNDPVLTGLVAQALKHNPSLRSAQAALRQARAQQAVVGAGGMPSLRASASAQRGQTGSADARNAWRAGLDASWELDLFGGQRSAEAASAADAETTAAQLAQAHVSLAAEVALVYLDWRGVQSRLRLGQASLALQEDTLQLTDWRVQAGLASAIDLEQARVAVAQSRAALPALQTAEQQALNALAVLTGRPPGALAANAPATLDPNASALATSIPAITEPASTGLQPPLPSPPPLWALGVPADTLRQRPDIWVAEQRLVAAVARVGQAQAARYPGLNLTGTLGWQSPRLTDLFDVAGLTRSLVLGATGALFDGGANRAQVQAQQAVVEQARLGLETALLTALKEVEDALVALQGTQQRLRHLQLAADSASLAETLARHRYRSGLIDFRTLLDAQRTLVSAQNEWASAQVIWATDHVRLYKALGGGWTPAGT
jgi:outer membrane protein, multidrug efflux system